MRTGSFLHHEIPFIPIDFRMVPARPLASSIVAFVLVWSLLISVGRLACYSCATLVVLSGWFVLVMQELAVFFLNGAAAWLLLVAITAPFCGAALRLPCFVFSMRHVLGHAQSLS